MLLVLNTFMIRGSGSGIEYIKEEKGFIRGIVVKNNDPEKLNRVKVFIPEISNQPYDDWIEKFETLNIKTPGANLPNDNLSDTKIFEDIAKLLPWAEPCYPIMGEGSSFKYYKDGEISTISDCNYPEGFEVINDETPTLQSGSFSPSYLYENIDSVIGDFFQNSTSGKVNPYAFSYRSSKHSNAPKGIFGVPDVGSKVWVFFYRDDLNKPIYFGTYRDHRELSIINDTDNDKRISSKYPNDFEN